MQLCLLLGSVCRQAVSSPLGNDDLCGGKSAHLICYMCSLQCAVCILCYVKARAFIWLRHKYAKDPLCCAPLGPGGHTQCWQYLGCRVANWYDYGGKYGKWPPTDAAGQQRPNHPLHQFDSWYWTCTPVLVWKDGQGQLPSILYLKLPRNFNWLSSFITNLPNI